MFTLGGGACTPRISRALDLSGTVGGRCLSSLSLRCGTRPELEQSSGKIQRLEGSVISVDKLWITKVKGTGREQKRSPRF